MAALASKLPHLVSGHQMKIRLFPALVCECGLGLRRIDNGTLKCDNPACKHTGHTYREPVFYADEDTQKGRVEAVDMIGLSGLILVVLAVSLWSWRSGILLTGAILFAYAWLRSNPAALRKQPRANVMEI